MKKLLFALVMVLVGCSKGEEGIKRPESYNYQRGSEAVEKGELEEGMTYLRKELQDNPKNGYAWVWIMCAHREKKEHGEALSAGAKALKLLPKKDKYFVAYTHAMIGKTYEALGEKEKAVEEISKAIKLRPDNKSCYSERGELYYRMGNYKESDKDYEKIVELEPGNSEGYIGLGRNLLKLGMYSEAADRFSYAVKLDDELSQAYAFRARCYLGMGKNHEAASDIVKALEIDANDMAFSTIQNVNDTCYKELIPMMKVKAAVDELRAEWMFYLGAMHQKHYHFREAIECYKEVIAENEISMVYEDISDCYESMGNYPAALKYINMAIARDTSEVSHQISKANLYYYSGQPQKAIEEMDKLIRWKPDYSYAYYTRGFMKDNLRDVDGAIEDYTCAIVLDDRFAYSYLGRADMYMLKGDTAAARTDYENAARLDSVIGETGDCRQYALLMLGMMDSAEVHMNHILEQDSSAGNFYDAACLMSRMGEQERALTYLKKAFEKGYIHFAHMELDDDMNGLRDTEEYKALVEEWKERLDEKNTDTLDAEENVKETSPAILETTDVPFKKDGNMMMIDCTINNLPLHFIFDTGAGDVSISDVEANFMMKNGFLSQNDIIGKAKYSLADGSVHEGTVLNLRSVNFGGLELKNVRASVVKNQKAPLLLGQSVFERLGRIEIDNEKRVVKVTHAKN